MRQGEQADLIMYAEAQGVITAKDGDGMATYTVQGIGRFTDEGKTVLSHKINGCRKFIIPW